MLNETYMQLAQSGDGRGWMIFAAVACTALGVLISATLFKI